MGTDVPKKPAPAKKREIPDLTPVDDLGGVANPLEFGIEQPTQPIPPAEEEAFGLDLSDLGPDDLDGVADPLDFGKPVAPESATTGPKDEGLWLDLEGLDDGGDFADLEAQVEGFDDPGGLVVEKAAIGLEDFETRHRPSTTGTAPVIGVRAHGPAAGAPPAERTVPPSPLSGSAHEDEDAKEVEDGLPRPDVGLNPLDGSEPPRLLWRDGRWVPTADVLPRGMISGVSQTARPAREEPGARPWPEGSMSGEGSPSGGRDGEATEEAKPQSVSSGIPRSVPAARTHLEARRVSGLRAVRATLGGRVLFLVTLVSVVGASAALPGAVALGWALRHLRVEVEQAAAQEESDAIKVADLALGMEEAEENAEEAQAKARRLGETAREAYDRAVTLREENRYEESTGALRDLIERFPGSDLLPQARAAIQENARLDRESRKGGSGP